jgi:hypothetical protein
MPAPSRKGVAGFLVKRQKCEFYIMKSLGTDMSVAVRTLLWATDPLSERWDAEAAAAAAPMRLSARMSRESTNLSVLPKI